MTKSIKIPKVSEVKQKDFNSRVATMLYDQINTKVSRKCKDLLHSNDIEGLISMEIDPSDYTTSWDFAIDYQAVSFLKKGDFLHSGIDTEKVALEKFLDAELHCKNTNESLKESIKPFRDIVSRANRICSNILGVVPEIKGQFKLGPGATSAVKGSFVTIPDKLEKHIVCPFSSINLVKEFYKNSAPRLLDVHADIDPIGEYCQTVHSSSIEVRDYNELTFVPKTAKADRPICIEPHSLIPLQKFFGDKIRRSLLGGGINLNNQTKVNIELCRLGSIDGSYATIDLSSASDTLSIAAVAELVPIQWFSLLSDARSPFTKLPDGQFLENEKFSSMGNGFTFELESLIFYSLARAVCEKFDVYEPGKMSVFGDDIIVPTICAEMLCDVLVAMGFLINKEKTFLSGPFRESCGSDFFLGTPVRPFFYKKGIQIETDKFKVCNGILAWNRRLGFPTLDIMYSRKTIEYIIRSLKPIFRLAGPVHLGDCVIHVSQQESYELGMQGRKNQFGISSCRAVMPVQRTKSLDKLGFSSLVQVLSALYGSSQRVPLRNQVDYYIKRTNPVYWPD
jgi:hypothetical protein